MHGALFLPAIFWSATTNFPPVCAKCKALNFSPQVLGENLRNMNSEMPIAQLYVEILEETNSTRVDT